MREQGTQVRQPSPPLVMTPCIRSPKLLGGAAVITGLAASLAALSKKKAQRRQHCNQNLLLALTQHHINEYQNNTLDLINLTASLHAVILSTPSSTASTDDLDTLVSQFTTLFSNHMDYAATTRLQLPPKKSRPPITSSDTTWLSNQSRELVKTLRHCSNKRGPLPLALFSSPLLHTTDYMTLLNHAITVSVEDNLRKRSYSHSPANGTGTATTSLQAWCQDNRSERAVA
jgi:hypothetical protein